MMPGAFGLIGSEERVTVACAVARSSETVYNRIGGRVCVPKQNDWRRIMRMASMLIMAAVLAAPASARVSMKERGEAELAKLLKGYVPGEKVRCVRTSDITNQTVIDGTAIVYFGLGGKAWVNRPNGAEFLHEDNILITKPFGGENCRLDIVRQADPFTHTQGASIVLNDFTLYTKVKTR
jgi:hypothetical protein